MTTPPPEPPPTEPPATAEVSAGDGALDPPDAALAAAATGDTDAPFDRDALLAASGAGRTLLEAIERTGLLLPHHLDAEGQPRYAASDVEAVRAGLTLLDAGLPLGELLDLARRTDAAIRDIADAAVEAFLRFVRDPVRGTATSEEEATTRLVTAYEEMLPATEQLVAHHLRRRLLHRAAERVSEELTPAAGPTPGGDPGDGPDRDPGDGPDRDPGGAAP